MSLVSETLSALGKILDPPPEERIQIGSSTVYWFETEPGRAYVFHEGPNHAERLWAERSILASLAEHGYKRQYIIVPDEGNEWRKQAFFKESDWDDVQAKAIRLFKAGNVQILRNGYNNIIAKVQGDHGEYEVEIWRDDPSSRALSLWDCECEWADYVWGRSRDFKKFEGRLCSHALAALYAAQATPLDADAGGPPTPGQRGPQPKTPADIHPPPGGQTQLDLPTHEPPPQPQPQQPTPQQTQPQLPPGHMPAGPTPPAGSNVLPPFPGEQLQMFPPGQLPVGMPAPPGSTVSVPGARPPTPFGPVQSPGGTYSKVAADDKKFKNGDIVRLEEAIYGITEGKSEAHGAGQYKEVPKNSMGEVLGQDDFTGWVEVIFEGPQDKAKAMEPYHVRAFVEPEKLTPMDMGGIYRPRIRR